MILSLNDKFRRVARLPIANIKKLPEKYYVQVPRPNTYLLSDKFDLSETRHTSGLMQMLGRHLRARCRGVVGSLGIGRQNTNP